MQLSRAVASMAGRGTVPSLPALAGLYLTVHTTHELMVDSSRGETISIDVSARRFMVAPRRTGAACLDRNAVLRPQ